MTKSRNVPPNCLAGSLRAERKRADILRLVLASGTTGLSMSEISAATGMRVGAVGVMLRPMRDLGLVESSQPRGGPGNRWGAPGTLAAYEAVHADRLARLAAKRAQRRQCADRKEADAEFVSSFDRPSIARIVPAHLAPPLRPRGPCSVFALGVAA